MINFCLDVLVGVVAMCLFLYLDWEYEELYCARYQPDEKNKLN